MSFCLNTIFNFKDFLNKKLKEKGKLHNPSTWEYKSLSHLLCSTLLIASSVFSIMILDKPIVISINTEQINIYGSTILNKLVLKLSLLQQRCCCFTLYISDCIYI